MDLEPPDAELLRKCIDGSAPALSKLYERYTPLVLSTAARTFNRYAYRATQEDIEDVHSEVFSSLMEDDFRRLRNYRGEAPFSAYLRVVSVRATIGYLKKIRYTASLDDLVVEPCDEPCHRQDHLLEQEQRINGLKRAVSALDDDERLLYRVLMSGAEPGAASSVLGVSLSVYYNRKSRLIKKIRGLIDRNA